MERFVGAWRLIAFEEQGPDGKILYPYGHDAVGLLIYDASGRMSVQITSKDRNPLSSTELLSAEEIKKSIEGFTSFFGTYEVDERNQIVIHRVEGHINPETVGKALRRKFEFSGNLLTLKPTPNRRVVWERLSPSNNC